MIKPSTKYLIICAISFTFFWMNASAFASRIRPSAFSGKLSLSKAPKLGEQATLTLQLVPLIDEGLKADIIFRLPDGLSFEANRSVKDIYLHAPVTAQHFTVISVEKEGNYVLQASVYATLKGRKRIVQHFFTYLSATENYSTLSNTPLPDDNIQPLTGKPIFVRRRALENAVNIGGAIGYFDDNKLEILPLRRVKVALYEGNKQLSDEQIETTFTDDRGEYAFSVENRDPEDGSKRDLYIQISFDNETLYIADRNGTPYKIKSETNFDVPDGEMTLDLALEEEDPKRGLGAIQNAIMDERDFIFDKVGWERKSIKVNWPSANFYTYYYIDEFGTIFDEAINIAAGDEWLRVPMLHEYAHSVMTAAYGGDLSAIPFGEYGYAHWVYTVSDMEFAMSEGWAEFMEAAVDDNAMNVTAFLGEEEPNIETNRWWTGDAYGNGSNMQGEKVEGTVASIFWDITDTEQSADTTPGLDDDRISDMFEQLWVILTSDRPRNIIEVAMCWKERGFPKYAELEAIYVTHSVSATPNSKPTITITAPPLNGSLTDSSYTITWEAEDEDGDEYRVDLFFDMDKDSKNATAIVSGLPNAKSYKWDTSGMPDGNYYIFAKITDARMNSNEDYSDGRLTIDHSPLRPPVVISATHPDQSRWYADKSPALTLTMSPQLTTRQYSYILNRTADSVPDTIRDTVGNSLSFPGLADGGWWVHIRAKDELGYWTDATHFRINIDTSKPPTVKNVRWAGEAEKKVELAWDEVDDISSIRQYHLQIAEGKPSFSQTENLFFDGVATMSPKTFVIQAGNTYFARVRAENGAELLGNWSNISEGYRVPVDNPWDVNGDMRVDISDLVLVATHFGEEMQTPPENNPDVNGDGVVDISDITLVALHFGETIAGYE